MDVANAVQPDLITLDLMMPGMSGLDLCELLHQDSRFANTPIMIITAKDDLESRERAKQAGAKEYLTKPFSMNTLIQKVKELTSS
jgi:DNA-binding response OmpR family regulator